MPGVAVMSMSMLMFTGLGDGGGRWMGVKMSAIETRMTTTEVTETTTEITSVITEMTEIIVVMTRLLSEYSSTYSVLETDSSIT